MANRLSLQSATCSAFQLQLRRQPRNDNSTKKTVSSFGSDCSRAMQSPTHNLTTWWGFTGMGLIHQACEEMSVGERKRLVFFLCSCTVCAVHYESMCLCVGEEEGGVSLTVLQWCNPPPVGCTAHPPPPRCPEAQRMTDPGSSLVWWPVCLPPEVLPQGSPADKEGDKTKGKDHHISVHQDWMLQCFFTK